MIVCGLGLVSNTEAKRLGLRGQTSAVDCSKNIIGLDFLVTFLSKTNASAFNEAKKTININELKVTRVWGGNPKNKINNFFCHFLCGQMLIQRGQKQIIITS